MKADQELAHCFFHKKDPSLKRAGPFLFTALHPLLLDEGPDGSEPFNLVQGISLIH